ncbi:MAG: MFS transporter permease, partial [Gammaproteobacteria bacterium]|nr:MFS transporter permease [Gammaproteobacteria bacterium]
MALADDIYNKLAEDEDSKICDDIDESACSHRRLSFVLILLSSSLTKLGDALASPKTTLAWAVTVVGAPAFVLGFLVPIR